MTDAPLPLPLKAALGLYGVVRLSGAGILVLFPELFTRHVFHWNPLSLTLRDADEVQALWQGGESLKVIGYSLAPSALLGNAVATFTMLNENKLSHTTLLSIAVGEWAFLALKPIHWDNLGDLLNHFVGSPFVAVVATLYTFYYDANAPYGLSLLKDNGSVLNPTWFFGLKLGKCKCGKTCGCCKCGANCSCGESCSCCKCGPDCKCDDAVSDCCKSTSTGAAGKGCKCGKSCKCCKCGPNCSCGDNCTCCKCGPDCKC